MSRDPDKKKRNVTDPLTPQPTVDLSDQAGSPFAPPDAYAPNVDTTFSYDEMHPYLQGLMDEHRDTEQALKAFTEMLDTIERERVVNDDHFAQLQRFMSFFDEEFIPHNRREERQLFPLLRQRMLEHGEHGVGENPHTPVTVLDREHIEMMQTGAVAFAFLALARKLEDGASRHRVLGLGLELARNLCKVIELHIFREEKIVFPMAQAWISSEAFDAMEGI